MYFELPTAYKRLSGFDSACACLCEVAGNLALSRWVEHSEDGKLGLGCSFVGIWTHVGNSNDDISLIFFGYTYSFVFQYVKIYVQLDILYIHYISHFSR